MIAYLSIMVDTQKIDSQIERQEDISKDKKADKMKNRKTG